tara:strand:+ start:1414 stop:1683 length:270 start_codon:yes stop_codon:yes gene_type:complete
MALIKNDRTGFPSLYRATYERGWDLKNLGFDYSKNLLNNTMSNYMFGNRHLKKFLEDYLSPIMVFWINRVKYLRIYYNFAVPKWYQKIN